MLDHFNLKQSDLFDFIGRVVGHEHDFIAGPNPSLDNPEMNDSAAIGIIVGIKNQRFQRLFGISGGRRQFDNDFFEQIFDPDAFFGGDQNGIIRIQPQIIVNL